MLNTCYLLCRNCIPIKLSKWLFWIMDKKVLGFSEWSLNAVQCAEWGSYDVLSVGSITWGQWFLQQISPSKQKLYALLFMFTFTDRKMTSWETLLLHVCYYFLPYLIWKWYLILLGVWTLLSLIYKLICPLQSIQARRTGALVSTPASPVQVAQ